MNRYLIIGAVLVTALLIGYWYASERQAQSPRERTESGVRSPLPELPVSGEEIESETEFGASEFEDRGS